MRACGELDAFRAAWRSWETYDVSVLLPQISVPTLVIHNRNSRWYPQAIGQRMAAAIPGARFVLIDDVTYASTPDLIEEFVFEGEAREPKQRSAAGDAPLAVILFADILDSTALTERLGDTDFRDKGPRP